MINEKLSKSSELQDSWEESLWCKTSNKFAVSVLVSGREWMQANLILTRRAYHLRQHRGQISFAGGGALQGESPKQTALRELNEELGVSSENVETLGFLSPCRSLDGGLVFPVVQWVNVDDLELTPCADEVAQTYRIPLENLKRTEVSEFRFNSFGNWRQSKLFNTLQCRIWGLTAEIIYRANF
jgi:8-oxo-dGTP pyrophosphatase MutT (NUDIX family)